eukprot:7611269-Pyramimonas_sp.AAC.1
MHFRWRRATRVERELRAQQTFPRTSSTSYPEWSIIVGSAASCNHRITKPSSHSDARCDSISTWSALGWTTRIA